MQAVLREGVLGGVAVLTAGEGAYAAAVRARLEALGAALRPALPPLGGTPGRTVVVWDGSGPGDGVDRVRAALDGAWETIRSVHAPDPQPGLIALLAPPPGDAHATAARGGLENLSRTLSIEWARFQTRPVTVLPGERTTPEEVAELVAYLASEAGAYYAGCAFTLR